MGQGVRGWKLLVQTKKLVSNTKKHEKIDLPKYDYLDLT